MTPVESQVAEQVIHYAGMHHGQWFQCIPEFEDHTNWHSAQRRTLGRLVKSGALAPKEKGGLCVKRAYGGYFCGIFDECPPECVHRDELSHRTISPR